MAESNRQFINGAFLKEVYNKNDTIMIGVWIPDITKLVAELQALPKQQFQDKQGNATQGFNLTIGTQKADKKKFSLWLDDYKKGGAPASQQPGYRPAEKQNSSYGATQQGAQSYGSGSGAIVEELPF